MSTKAKVLLRIINRTVYYGAAALMIAALVLGVVFQPAQASSSSNSVSLSDYQLNLSHIQCVNNQVEVHFVLLNVPDGVTPDNFVYFTLKINGGSASTQTAARGAHTGNVWHYSFYGTVNGKYDVTGAYVWVNGTKVYLHNPDDYSDTQQNCSAATATPTTVPPTATKTANPTKTATPTTVPPTATYTATPTKTATVTTVPPTATFTATPTTVPPTATFTFTPTATGTSLPTNTPTATLVPTTETPIPTTETPVPTTETPIPTTETVAPSETPIPTDETPIPTEVTPFIPVTGLSPLVLIDPYCLVSGGTLQWTVENPNSQSITVLYWTLDGGSQQAGFTAAPGSNLFTTTSAGHHTISVVYGESQSVSDTSKILVCPLPVPNNATGGLLIPVTGADQTKGLSNGLLYSGFSLAGLGLILSALRKFLHM